MASGSFTSFDLETLWNAWDAALDAVAAAQRTLTLSLDAEQTLAAERTLLHAELHVANVAQALQIAYQSMGGE